MSADSQIPSPEPVSDAKAAKSGIAAARGRGGAQRGAGDARGILDAAMSEAAFQVTVIELAKRTGWLVHHQIVPFKILPNGRHMAIVEPNTDPGFQDLVLCHEGRGLTIFPELKSESGRLSKDQERWRDALLAAGQDWRLWRPSDWPEI
jgi:hypothetical protein